MNQLSPDRRHSVLVRAKELGVPDLIDKIADESVGTTEEEIMEFLQKANHPCLSLDPIM